MTAWGRSIIDGVVNIFSRNETPYLRMFMIEHNKEYNFMLKQGYDVTEEIAESYIKSNT